MPCPSHPPCKLCYFLTYLQSLVLPEKLPIGAAIHEIPRNFKEPEGSSPRSQESFIGPYLEPVRSSSYHLILSLLRSILILSTIYVLVFPVVSFLLAFPPISYAHSSPPPFVLHAQKLVESQCPRFDSSRHSSIRCSVITDLISALWRWRSRKIKPAFHFLQRRYCQSP
jgi:hypothetical protein